MLHHQSIDHNIVCIVLCECLNIYCQVLKSVTVSQSQFSLCTGLYNINCCAGYREPTTLRYVVAAVTDLW